MSEQNAKQVRVQSRPAGAWETSRKAGSFRRLTLRRADGAVYLDRWGFSHDRVGGVLLHRMQAPDPGLDLHDHPWTFVSFCLWGGYTEERAETRDAPFLARMAGDSGQRGRIVDRRWLSVRTMRLDECHRITALQPPAGRSVWTLVVKGPRRRKWGFYLPQPGRGYLDEAKYDATVRAERRDLWSDQNEARPWATANRERDAIQRDIDRIASAYGLGPAQIEVVDPPRTTRKAEGDDGPPALNRAGRRAQARRR